MLSSSPQTNQKGLEYASNGGIKAKAVDGDANLPMVGSSYQIAEKLLCLSNEATRRASADSGEKGASSAPSCHARFESADS